MPELTTANGSLPDATERQIKHSVIYLVPAIVANAIPFATLPIFTRILTKEDYGAWALATAYAVFVTGLANFGLTVSYERNFFQYRNGKQPAELLHSIVVFVFSAFVACGVITWLLRAPLARWLIGDAGYAGLLFWAFCANGVVSLKIYYLTYFRNTADAKSYVWYTVDETVLGALFSLLLVVYARAGVYGLVLGQLMASLIVLAFVSSKCVRLLPLAFSSRPLMDSLKLGFPLTPRIFVGVLSNNFDKYLIRLLASVGGVGIYTIGQRIAYTVFTFMTALENVFSPQVYERMFSLGDSGREAIGRYLTPFVYVSAGMTLLVGIFAEEVLTLVTPSSYHGAIPVASILALRYGILFFGKQPQLVFARKTYLLSLLTIVNLGLNVGLNVLLIPLWGATGAAWGSLAVGVISGSLYFAIGQHYYRIRWEYRKLTAIFGLLGVSILLMVISTGFGVAYGVRLFGKVVFVAAFLGLGVRIGFLTREQYGLARGMLRSIFRSQHSGVGA